MAKPSTVIAMNTLIEEIRSNIPFHTPEATMCHGPCKGCPKKLMEYLDSELSYQEDLLAQGEQPNLGDIHRLGKTSRKIYTVLEKNGLISSQ